jgi:hypothetical protein
MSASSGLKGKSSSKPFKKQATDRKLIELFIYNENYRTKTKGVVKSLLSLLEMCLSRKSDEAYVNETPI